MHVETCMPSETQAKQGTLAAAMRVSPPGGSIHAHLGAESVVCIKAPTLYFGYPAALHLIKGASCGQSAYRIAFRRPCSTERAYSRRPPALGLLHLAASGVYSRTPQPLPT